MSERQDRDPSKVSTLLREVDGFARERGGAERDGLRAQWDSREEFVREAEGPAREAERLVDDDAAGPAN